MPHGRGKMTDVNSPESEWSGKTIQWYLGSRYQHVSEKKKRKQINLQNSYNDMLWEKHRKILVVQKCKDIFEKFYYAKTWTNLLEAQDKKRQAIRDKQIA